MNGILCRWFCFEVLRGHWCLIQSVFPNTIGSVRIEFRHEFKNGRCPSALSQTLHLRNVSSETSMNGTTVGTQQNPTINWRPWWICVAGSKCYILCFIYKNRSNLSTHIHFDPTRFLFTCRRTISAYFRDSFWFNSRHFYLVVVFVIIFYMIFWLFFSILRFLLTENSILLFVYFFTHRWQLSELKTSNDCKGKFWNFWPL